MLRRYYELLATPGALGFVVPGFLSRLPTAMRPLGCVLLLSAQTGSYTLAGAASATMTVAQAVMVPRLGRLADRHRQRWVLLGALAAHVVGIVSLVAGAQLRAPAWLLLVAAAVTGGSIAPVGSMIRTRWSTLLEDRPSSRLDRAYAFESVVDEVLFVTGPLLVGALVLGLTPAAGLLGCLVLVIVGSTLLAAHRRTEPPRPAEGVTTGRGAARIPGMRVLIAAFVASGALVGSVEVALVAFTQERADPGAAGLLISLFAAGSLVAAVAYGDREWRQPPSRRFLVAMAWLAVGTLPIVIAPTIALMAVAVTVVGIAQAPSTIAASMLVRNLVPLSARTEGFAWLTTAQVVGFAIGTSAAGGAIDLYGARPAFLIAAAAGLLGVAVVVLGRRHLAAAIPEEPGAQAGPPTRDPGTDGSAGAG